MWGDSVAIISALQVGNSIAKYSAKQESQKHDVFLESVCIFMSIHVSFFVKASSTYIIYSLTNYKRSSESETQFAVLRIAWRLSSCHQELYSIQGAHLEMDIS